MRTMIRLAGCGMVLALAVGGLRADEDKVPLDKLPKAVKDSVKKRFPKAVFVEATKETEDGETEYAVTIKVGQTKIDVTLTPDGTITLIERMITAKDLPKKVMDTLKSRYPRAMIKTIAEVIDVNDGKETLDYYEVVLVTAARKTLEIEISADGTIKTTEDR
jgi:hypothetical protein